MLFRRRVKSPGADWRSWPGASDTPTRALVVADLHVDFTGSGPMAAEGVDETAVRLADVVRQQQEAWRRQAAGASRVKVVVEGRLWGERAPLPADSPFPAHCEGPADLDLAAALVVEPESCYVWEFCPACGGDVLSAQAEGKGQLSTLQRSLEMRPPSRIDVAGLSAEHSAFALAEALATRFGPAGTEIAFWPDLSSFLHPDQAPARLARLEQAGVRIEAGEGIDAR